MAFTIDRIRYSCTRSDMATALEMSILLTYSLTPSDDAMLISNTTYSDYLQHYAEYRDRYNREAPRASNATYTFWATYLYDSVWAWALVLDNLTKTQDSFELGTHYGNLEHSDMIVEQFYCCGCETGILLYERGLQSTSRTPPSDGTVPKLAGE